MASTRLRQRIPLAACLEERVGRAARASAASPCSRASRPPCRPRAERQPASDARASGLSPNALIAIVGAPSRRSMHVEQLGALARLRDQHEGVAEPAMPRPPRSATGGSRTARRPPPAACRSPVTARASSRRSPLRIRVPVRAGRRSVAAERGAHVSVDRLRKDFVPEGGRPLRRITNYVTFPNQTRERLRRARTARAPESGPLLGRRRGQRERQRLAVRARAQRVGRADVLPERDRHRVVGDRRGPGRLRERDLQRLRQRERAVDQVAGIARRVSVASPAVEITLASVVAV